jgi:hypothetical protein
MRAPPNGSDAAARASGCSVCIRSRLRPAPIQLAFQKLGLPRLTGTPKRRARQLKLFTKEAPGDSVQIDVKFVKVRGRQYYQYTAIDDCTRYRVLRLYRQLHAGVVVVYIVRTCVERIRLGVESFSERITVHRGAALSGLVRRRIP